MYSPLFSTLNDMDLHIPLILVYCKATFFKYTQFSTSTQCLQWLRKTIVISLKLRRIFPIKQPSHSVDANVTKKINSFTLSYLFTHYASFIISLI